jgi:hypothetical protein
VPALCSNIVSATGRIAFLLILIRASPPTIAQTQTTQTFLIPGSSYTVQSTGTYEMEAASAQAGVLPPRRGRAVFDDFGGLISGDLSLTAGETLTIAVGGGAVG